MERAKKALTYSLFLLPLVLVFKNFLNISNPLVWGDAPYFYPENLKELFNIPYIWDIRNANFGSPQFLTLWLYTSTFLLGLLHKIFGFNNEIAIRLVFYIPFFICGSLGIFLLLKRFNFSNLAKAFGMLFYILNTYSLVLIDGGQIGVMLSYGLFPLVFVSFLKFLDKNLLKFFSLTFIGHFFIFNTDLRIALILLVFEMIWATFLMKAKKVKNILKMSTIYFLVLGFCSFWILPFLEGLRKSGTVINLEPSNFIRLYHSFYLFQPHFPNNDFGNLNRTPVYFIFIPLLLFLGLLRKSRFILKLAFLFLLFAFLSKGSSSFLGAIYNIFVNNIPLGSAFRDSSKFYIPAMLVASILLANTTDVIKNTFKRYKFLWTGIIYLTLILTIYPALTGNLSGVLGKKPDTSGFYEIFRLIKNENFSIRTLWFSERPPLGFSDWNHPAVSANLLFKERPFASMIDGEYDLFGFLHNKNISDWYELLGIKYIFYPPNTREKSLTNKEWLERRQFEDFASKIPNVKKINLPIDFPVYETVNPIPKIFAQEKILFVVGGDDVYKNLFMLNNFALEKNGLIFLESCKFDPEMIFTLKPESFGLVITKDKNDLYLSYFCRDFISPSDSKIKEWSVNDTGKYLNWKAQLLERGIRNYDYDFNEGIAYSTQEGEKLRFDLKISERQNYYLPIRFLTATQSSGLKVNFAGDEQILKSENGNKLQWELIGPVDLKSGNYELTITNLGGLGAVNTLGLIPESSFENKKNQINEKLKTLTVFDIKQVDQLEEFLKGQLIPADYWQTNPAEYQVRIPKGANWLVFSERYDDSWLLQSHPFSRQPLPFYSMINGYYVGDISYGNLDKIYYTPQRFVNIGLLISLLTFSLLCFGIISHIILRGRFYGSIKKYFRNLKN